MTDEKHLSIKAKISYKVIQGTWATLSYDFASRSFILSFPPGGEYICVPLREVLPLKKREIVNGETMVIRVKSGNPGIPVYELRLSKLQFTDKQALHNLLLELVGVENAMNQNDVLNANWMSKLCAFASSISEPPDGTLIVGTNKIPIHKMYLSYYSEYFKTMFRSEFIEGCQDEIVLEEVGYLDMLQLLSVIYPSHAPITDKNLKNILKLADRFIMPSVLEQCKNVLKTSTLNGAQKLLLAQQYYFKDLQKEFAQQCKTIAHAKILKAEPEFKQLDHETCYFLFDSMTS